MSMSMNTNYIPRIHSFIDYINDLILANQKSSFEMALPPSQLWWLSDWFFIYSSLILFTFTVTIIFSIGLILPKTPLGVSTLNTAGALSIIAFLIMLPAPHSNITKILIWFDYNSFVYLYIIIGGIFTAGFLALNNEITFFKENRHIEFPLLIILVYLFGIVVVASENFISTFLALEAITLISAVLIGFQRSNNLSTLAGIRYILFSAVPGGALLLGISELYAYTGSFNFSDIEKLLINYNETFIDDTTLTHVGQTLHNALDMVLFYNFDQQFSIYTNALHNSEVFYMNIQNNFLFEDTSQSHGFVLEQIDNYENSVEYNANMEHVSLSVLGNYISRGDINHEDSVKLARFHIYKHLIQANYTNYLYESFAEVIKSDSGILDICTNMLEPDYKRPAAAMDELTSLDEIRKDPSYKEFYISDNMVFYVNFHPDVFKSSKALKFVNFIRILAIEQNITADFLESDQYQKLMSIYKKLHPVFLDEALNSLDLVAKNEVWNGYNNKFILQVLPNNEISTNKDTQELTLDWLLESKTLLESKLAIFETTEGFKNLKQNETENFSNLTQYLDFYGTENIQFTLNAFFYGFLSKKLEVVNLLISQLNEGLKVERVFLNPILDKNSDFHSLFLDFFNKVEGIPNPPINTPQELEEIFTGRVEFLAERIEQTQLAMEHYSKINFYSLFELENGRLMLPDIVFQSNFYDSILKLAFDELTKSILTNGEESNHFLKLTLKPHPQTNLDYLESINPEMAKYLYASDLSYKKEPLNLVSVNHNYQIPSTIYVSIFLIIFYILFKLTAAPFHMWAPSIYEGAPLPITIFLSIFSKITMIFLLIKLLVFYFYFIYPQWGPLLLLSGVMSIIAGIYGAIAETRIKRFFIYSSMGHVGFMLLGIAQGGIHGITATLIYLIIYMVTVFIGWTILLSADKNITHINQLKGLSKTNPTLSFIFALSMLSMSGIPPLAGFFVKLDILYSLIGIEFFNIALLALFLTVISFFYYLRIIKILYFEPIKMLKYQFRLNKMQSTLLAACFLFLVGFVMYFQQPVIYAIKNILIQSIN